MTSNLIHGLTALGNGPAIAYLVVGSLIGMFFGVIPGLGGVVILSIALAFIAHISLVGTLALFLAVQAGSFFSASVTSILLNTPAHPEAFAVTFDGFPMAQRGEAGRALGISATSTCIGGLLGCAALVGFIQIINVLPTLFHPPEYVGLVSIALILVGTLGAESPSKAVMSAGIGVMISSIGVSTVTGAFRFTFGAIGLDGGISLVALALGCFAIPQMVMVFGTGTTVARQDMTGKEITATQAVGLTAGFRRQVFQGMVETLHHWVALVRSALVGVVCGIIPGVGAFAANFLSYGIAQQTSKNRKDFGTGIPEGIIAPEGSSLSKEAAGLVPLIALGIPGGVGSALFLGALSIKGIHTGYGFASSYPVLPYEMAWVVAIGGIIGTASGVLAAPLLARVTHVPGPLLVPFIMSLSVVGAFVADVQFFSVMEVLVFGLVGLALRRMRYSLAAFAVGLVLGPTLETNLYLTHTLYPGWTFLVRRPVADLLFVLAIGILVVKGLQLRADSRAQQAEFDARIAAAGEVHGHVPTWRPYPLLGLVTTLGIAAVAFFFVIYGQIHYKFATAIMPTVGGSVAGAAALVRLPMDFASAWRWASFRLASRRAGAAPVTPVVVALPEPIDRFEPEVSTATAEDGGGGGAVATATQISVATETTRSYEPKPIRDKEWGWNGQYTRELVALGWIGALVTVCYVFGFNVGVPVFCGAYGMLSTRRTFHTLRSRFIFAALSAGALWLVAYFIISRFLHIVFTPVIGG